MSGITAKLGIFGQGFDFEGHEGRYFRRAGGLLDP